METERLVLREYSDEDLENLISILTDPVTMSFWPSPFTDEQVSEWITNNMKSYKEERFGRWAIILKETNQLIGDCGLKRYMIDGNLENDLGYIIGQEYWHRGFALEAATACMDFAINELKLTRLCANMAVNHIRSRNVAIRLGMSLEKTFINQHNRNILTYLYTYNVRYE